MKHLIRVYTLMIAMLAMTCINCQAKQSDKVESTMNEIVKKYETSPGVSCVTVVKGKGLELMKMMFNKEFGRDFMKGVTSITLIDYSDASAQTCDTLRKELDAFLSLLEEFDVSKEKQFADNDYIRCFASASDSGTLSDFVLALENEDSKVIMYMAGKIVIK